MAKAEACRMGEEKEVVEAKCKDVDQEKYQLRKELEELQAFFDIQNKELESLRMGFAAENEKLKEDYRKQVDEMFLFGYQCCMRKNDITQDIPSYLSGEDDATVSGLAQENKNPDVVGPSDEQ